MQPGNKPLFSVIVPAYNVEEYISQCINSVLEQNFTDYELIIVDDGSTDHTGKICDEYQKSRDKHDKNQPNTSIVAQNSKDVNSETDRALIKIIHQANAGLSAARNAGVKVANGEYLIFLDGDDYLEEGALSAIQNGLEPELDLLRYQAQEVFPDGRKVRHAEPGFATTSGIKAFSKLASYHYTENAWLYAYHRDFFMQNDFRYAEGRLAEDFGLTPLIVAKATSVKAIPNICYNYRQRENSIMHDSAKSAKRVEDVAKQLQYILPKIAMTPGAKPILHYLVVSFLTGATELGQTKFSQIYQDAKQAGLLKYVHPTNIRAVPRALLLRHFPDLFYRAYHLD